MVEEIVKTYHVAYERDASGWWVASVRELRGCRTQGRTVDEARRRIREAIGLFIDNVRTAKIVDNVKLPADAKKAISAYAKLRKKADENDRLIVLRSRLEGGRIRITFVACVLEASGRILYEREIEDDGYCAKFVESVRCDDGRDVGELRFE